MRSRRGPAILDRLFVTEIFGPPTAINSNAEGNRSRAGKVELSPRLVAGERTFVVLGAPAQSNQSNYCGAYYSPASDKVQNFDLYSGAVVKAEGALLGCGHYQSGHYFPELGEKLIAADKCDRVIFIPIGLGGTTIAQWTPSGNLWPRLRVAIERLQLSGFAVTHCLAHIGESDNQQGTTTQAWIDAFNAMLSAIRAMGVDAPCIVPRASMSNGGTISQSVRAAQLAVVSGPNGVIEGPDFDTLGSLYRQTDGVHFNEDGRAALTDMLLPLF